MVLHANWHDEDPGDGLPGPHLLIWSDSLAGDVSGGTALRDALSRMCSDELLPSAARETRISIWLPGDALPAPALASDTVARDPAIYRPDPGPARLQLYRPAALQFSAAEAMDLLLAFAQPIPENCGDSIRYWATLARFVLEQMRRQLYFPTIVQRGQRFEATWRLVLTDRVIIDQLERLAGAMPPSCRAIASAESPDPLDLIESFLNAAVDALVRRSVSTDPFFTRVHALANAPDAPPDVRWVSALLNESRVINGNARELSAIADLVHLWTARLDESAAATQWQLGFALIEPPTPDEANDSSGEESFDQAEGPGDKSPGPDQLPWRLVFRLHPMEESDPAHSGESAGPVDAAEVWSDGGGSLRLLGRNLAERREMLLAELHRASETFPLLSRALSQPSPGDQSPGPAPAELILTTAEAHLFLRQWSVELRENNFIVQLPDWAEARERHLSLVMALRPESMIGGPGDLSPGPDEEDSPTSPSRRGGTFEISGGKLGLESLLRFDWRVAVGGVEISPEKFQSLLDQQSPLIRHGGRWIEIDREAARAAAEVLREKSSGTITLGEAFRTAWGPGDMAPGPGRHGTQLPRVSLTGTSWIRQLLEGPGDPGDESPGPDLSPGPQSPDSRLQELTQPLSFGGTLRPYQLRGLQWLVFLHRLGIGGCLADDMGLGKTIQLIALLLYEREGSGVGGQGSGDSGQSSSLTPDPSSLTPSSIGPTLLFAPTSVVGNWVKELERFAPSLRVMLHHGPGRLRGEALAESAQRHDIVITSYALAYRDIDSIAKVPWHRLALDEAQKIKNPSAASSVAIRSLAAPHRVALTGTPIENHLSELWSIMDMLNPGLLGSAREFRERFSVPIEKLSDQETAGHLKKLIRPFVLRRTKSDPEVAGDLPEKMEMKVFCTLTPEQAAMYERVTGEMLGQIDSATGIRRRGLILAVLTRLKQICDHPTLVAKDSGPLDGRSGKCERLVEMLEEVLEEGEAALVFTQYREMGHLLEQIIPQRLGRADGRSPVQFLHGGTPQKQRDEMVQTFQSPLSDKRIFILSLRAGGLGLNLTAATHVFHFDRWWNPAVEQQATDRAHRIGQQRRVQVHKFVSMGTVEERIDRLLSEKMQLAETIVGSGDEWLTGLSTAELTEYLKLSDEAVGDY